jgi:segregation and condensation protein B
MDLTPEQIKSIIESLLFVSGDPLTLKQIKDIISTELDDKVLRQIMAELQEEMNNPSRGIQLIEIAHGYRLTTKAENTAWVQKLVIMKQKLKLTKAAIETLAVIAYRQPIVRAEIEAIRGVDCGGVLQTLMERKLIKSVGHKEVIGRPLMYGTTTEFLDQFGLKNLNDLPTLDELSDDAATDDQDEFLITQMSASASPDTPAAEGDAASSAPPFEIVHTQEAGEETSPAEPIEPEKNAVNQAEDANPEEAPIEEEAPEETEIIEEASATDKTMAEKERSEAEAPLEDKAE